MNFIILSTSTDLAAQAGGYTIAVVGWVIVFIALAVLVFIFMGFIAIHPFEESLINNLLL